MKVGDIVKRVNSCYPLSGRIIEIEGDKARVKWSFTESMPKNGKERTHTKIKLTYLKPA